MNKIINEVHNEEFFKKVQPHLPVRELGNCSVYKPAYCTYQNFQCWEWILFRPYQLWSNLVQLFSVARTRQESE